MSDQHFRINDALSGSRVVSSPGIAIMQLDLDLIFHIRNPASAELMTLKAVCLWNAGVIDARQKRTVEQRARKFSQEDKILQATSGAYGIKTTRPQCSR